MLTLGSLKKVEEIPFVSKISMQEYVWQTGHLFFDGVYESNLGNNFLISSILTYTYQL